MNRNHRASLVSQLHRIDWDFAGTYSNSDFSAIHWHPARFVSQIAAALIGMLSDPAETVLDPFVGSGTTCVEAQRLCRRSIGIDLNPIACLMARAKTLSIPATKIERIINDIVSDATIQLQGQGSLGRDRVPLVEVPTGVQLQKWYSARVRANLRTLWSLLHTYSRERRIIAEAAFSAILMPVCRETRHWGYICDNTEPKGDKDVEVLPIFTQTLRFMERAYNARDADIGARTDKRTVEKAEVLFGDVRDLAVALPDGSIDLVVTSPPYFGVSDYIKSQRLSMEWFGYDIEPLRLREIGARSKRRRTDAQPQYLKELAEVFGILRKKLKRGRFCVVVIGESDARRAVVESGALLLAESGLKLIANINRTVSSQRRQNPSITGEHVLVFEK